MGKYASRYDAKQFTAVWAFSGSSVDPASWKRHLDDMRALHDQGPPAGRPSVLLELVDDLFVPNAVQRREIAEATDDPRYRACVAVLSRNSIAVGVAKTLLWLQKEQHFKLSIFSSLDGAMGFLEKERGSKLPRILELREEVYRELLPGKTKI